MSPPQVCSCWNRIMTSLPHEIFNFVWDSQIPDVVPEVFVLNLRCLRPFPSTSRFNNRYSYLQEYCPLCVHNQNKISSMGCLDNGIFLMSLASSRTNRPLIISSFHVCVSSLISTSTAASSYPSKIGEDTRVGCLIGSHICCQI